MAKEEKYYGVLMVRQSITPLVYALKPMYVISGYLKADDDKKMVDDMNNEYYLSDDTSTVFLDMESSVGFLIPEEELLKKYPNCSEPDARAKYFDEITKKVHFYSIDTVGEEKVSIVSMDLESMIDAKINGLTEDDDKDLLSVTLSNNDGDEIVTITLDELKRLINLDNNDELRARLQQIYDDTMDMHQYFQDTGSIKKSPLDYLKKLTGQNLSLMFNGICDEILKQNDLDEIRKIYKSIENAMTGIASSLESYDRNSDEIKAAIDVIYRIIDCFNDTLEEKTLDSLKIEIKKIRCQEWSNIKRIGEVIDEYNALDKNKYKEEADTKVIDPESQPVRIMAPVQAAKAILPFNVLELKQKLDRKVVGQEEAKIDVISALVTNHMKVMLGEEPDKRNAYLLVGPTGSGKTLIVSTVTKYLSVPTEIVDSMQITIAGYVGANIEDCLVRLLEKANGNLELAQRGVIVFDEIDKKGTEKNGDVSGRGVLNTLLSFIQGTTYKIKYKNSEIIFDTSKLTIFATGAFADVVKKLHTKTENYKGTAMGFGADLTKKKQEVDIDYPILTKEDLSKYGNMPDELIGRIRLTQLNGHTKESLREVLLESESSPLFTEQRLIAALGAELRWTDGFVEKLIEQAIKQKTGGRSLQDEIEKSIKKARWLVMTMPGVYSAIIMSAKTVENNLDCEIIDRQGMSYPLAPLYEQLPVKMDEDEEKGHQKVL